MSSAFTVTSNDNVTAITGELPFDVSGMKPCGKHESWVSIDKIQNKEQPIMPNSIDWNKVTRNAWFICINPVNGLNYSFPIAEYENRDNNFERARKGIAYFHSQKYKIYSIGS
jgi:hypothetical protein